MSDPRASLTEIIAELHDALEEPDSLPENLRTELRKTAEDILEALDASDESELSLSLRDRLTATLDKFEESHPRLTEIVGRVADALSDLGI